LREHGQRRPLGAGDARRHQSAEGVVTHNRIGSISEPRRFDCDPVKGSGHWRLLDDTATGGNAKLVWTSTSAARRRSRNSRMTGSIGTTRAGSSPGNGFPCSTNKTLPDLRNRTADNRSS
jgi:hypothetical protein